MKKLKINISRQYIYLISFSIFLLIFVLLFAFLVLIPEGKEYRKSRVNAKTQMKELRKYQDFNDETEVTLKKLQKEHRHTIIALDTLFNPSKFQKQHEKYFSSLQISKLERGKNEKEFAMYEVNAVSKMSSPKGFYDFLDAINKSDWIVGIDFPIDFTRDSEIIKLTFAMKVYFNAKDENRTKRVKK